MPSETFQENSLTLELHDEAESVSVRWLGTSTAREPGKFILRVLTQALDLASAKRKPVVFDFQNMGYMNSSTITPIIRILERVKRASSSVRVLYRKSLKWQELSFTALEVFQTPDHRIEICAV